MGMKSIASTAAVFALVLGVFGPVSTVSAMAQTAATSGPISLGDLFGGSDNVDLTASGTKRFRDGTAKAKGLGECPRAKVTVVVKKGDPLFQSALGLARRDTLLRQLGEQARYFLFEVDSTGTFDDVRIDYNAGRDREKPNLHTSSVPPKGSKVKTDQEIKVTMVARDDANRWQTGIKFIRLTDETVQTIVGYQSYERPPADCTDLPPQRTLTRIYTVPANPPPIVRLRALTEDFAGHADEDTAEFPTGDWYGTLTYSYTPQPTAWALQASGRLDVSLKYDGRGNLTGTMAGTQEQVIEIPNGPLAPHCSKSITPATFKAKLLGQYTPSADAMSIQAVEPEYNPGNVTPCPPSGPLVQPSPDANALFRQVLRGLRPVGDGVFQSEVEQTYSGQGPTALTVKYSLTLRRAAN
jgi:hypothetical protein